MKQLWQGRFSKALEEEVNDFNSSIAVDSLMYREDIRGSIAHAIMLGEQGIISAQDSSAIVSGLEGILSDIESGKLSIDCKAEDIHTFVESVLTERIGDAGKRLHTARSRNDQVATDTRLYAVARTRTLVRELNELNATFVKLAQEHKHTVMPGYTHLQRAQPISFAQQLMAYSAMFERDCLRLLDTLKRVKVSPLGSAAFAGTSFDINRFRTAELLGFDSPCSNSIDGVSDRDYVIELSSDIALVMIHLSRLSEEIILWSSWEFKFIELDDGYATGSSIMPQKKNPDIAELVRGKTGRAIGNLVALLTMMKGLPLAYNKDMQEDKESLFDSFDTADKCVSTVIPMLRTMKVLPDNMRAAADKGFINATDCADYLVGKGLPFRSAYKVSGELVAYCISKCKVLKDLSLDEFRSFSPLFDEGIYNAIDMAQCVEKRNSYGATSPSAVTVQIEKALQSIASIGALVEDK